jgi:tryptophan synthase alpha chain
VQGVTGTKSAPADQVRAALARIRAHTKLPVAVGFGIRTPAQAAEIAKVADAAVVGSALVSCIGAHVSDDGKASPKGVEETLALVRALAAGVRRARQ